MPISSRFSSSADGRLQKLPSLPQLGLDPAQEEHAPPPNSPPHRSVLEEGGALQGVGASAHISNPASRGPVDTIGDALLVSRRPGKSDVREKWEKWDESDLAAGRKSRSGADIFDPSQRHSAGFDEELLSVEGHDEPTSRWQSQTSPDESPASQWQPQRRAADASRAAARGSSSAADAGGGSPSEARRAERSPNKLNGSSVGAPVASKNSLDGSGGSRSIPGGQPRLQRQQCIRKQHQRRLPRCERQPERVVNCRRRVRRREASRVRVSAVRSRRVASDCALESFFCVLFMHYKHRTRTPVSAFGPLAPARARQSLRSVTSPAVVSVRSAHTTSRGIPTAHRHHTVPVSPPVSSHHLGLAVHTILRREVALPAQVGDCESKCSVKFPFTSSGDTFGWCGDTMDISLPAPGEGEEMRLVGEGSMA